MARNHRETTAVGTALLDIMSKKGMGTSALADAMGGKNVATVTERIYQKNISIDKLSEMVKLLGYKITLVPFGTRGDDFYDVG